MATWRGRALPPYRRSRRGGQEPPAPEVSMELRPAPPAPPVEDSLIDAAIYREGRRVESPATLAETYRLLRHHEGGMAWIGLYRPGEAQLLAAGEEFGLHELA